jgi:hypothetical protein
MKKLFISIFSILIIGYSFTQNPLGVLTPGPEFYSNSGVIDGVVRRETVSTKYKVPYPTIVENNWVWSKRIYSRIDCRESINHNLFLPNDYINDRYNVLDLETNTSDPNWQRNSERYSLWTLIRFHIINGDLQVFAPSSEEVTEIEDGYSLKHEIVSNIRNPFFKDPVYREKISKLIGFRELKGSPSLYYYDNDGAKEKKTVKKDGTTLKDYLENEEYAQLKAQWYKGDSINIKKRWDNTPPNEEMCDDLMSYWVTSKCIVAYNIKEDWFFDKNRSRLERRIIAIAPVAKFLVSNQSSNTGNNSSTSTSTGERGQLLLYPPSNKETLHYFDNTDLKPLEAGALVEERELFWLYFPNLRDYLVNYYIYNNKSDVSTLSFDDLFWKRQFSSQIYKTTNKFDDEVEEYKYGVDALYEAERIKNEIRNWEMDLWEY